MAHGDISHVGWYKNGVAALELQRDLGITYKSAWFMVHRIRQAMANRDNGKMFGTIVADETWVGGKPKNRHNNGKATPTGARRHTDKTPILTLVNADTGEVRSQVVPDVHPLTLQPAIAKQVEINVSTLHTDESKSYKSGFASNWIAHETVNHSQGEYVRNGVSTNKAENFFSQMKRSLDRTTTASAPSTSKGMHANSIFARRQAFLGWRAWLGDDGQGKGTHLSYRALIEYGPVAMGTRPRPVGRPGPR